jgi:hypothetical protein
MNIMKRIKEYFSGECVEPKTQDEIVGQLKNISEPTYMLAKAIDEGVVKVYGKITTDDCYSTQYGISLVFPDKQVVKGWVSRSRYRSSGGILYLSGFNSEEREYLFVSVKKAIERNEAKKEAKLQAVIDAKNAAIRNQITESLQATTK